MRIVVTGATGNLGTALLEQLATDPGHQVVGIARRPPGPAGPPASAWHQVDLTDADESATLREVFDGADVVVHLAWGFQPTHDPAYLHQLGVGGTRRVLAAATAAGVPHLVHLSSVGAYSPANGPQPVTENWPTGGIRTSRYSRDKVAAERLLDEHDATGRSPRTARLRPGLRGRRDAASALLRYGVPTLFPARVLDHVPVLPLDRDLAVPLLHTRDVARALHTALQWRATGAFNLAADPPVTPTMLAQVLGARHLHVPYRVLRPAMSISWQTHLQPVDPGWLDLAMAVPLLDTTRARTELDWAPTLSTDAVLREVLDGMRRGAADGTSILRPRTVAGQVARLRHGPVSRRRLP